MVAAPRPAPQTVDLGDMVMYGFGAIPTIGSAVTANTATNAAPYTGARSIAGRVATTGVRKIILNRSGAKKPATKAAATKVAVIKTATRNNGAKTSADTGAPANDGEACIVAAASTVGKTSAKPGGSKKRKASNDEEPCAPTASPSNNNGEYNTGNPCVVVANSDPESERPLKRRLRPRKAIY